jgi:hypothetical protein
MPGQEWMFGLTEGAFCWNAHSNYSSISGPFCFKNVGFCIDAGDLEISFLTRGTRYKKATGLTMASAKGFDFYMFCQIVRRFLGGL